MRLGMHTEHKCVTGHFCLPEQASLFRQDWQLAPMLALTTRLTRRSSDSFAPVSRMVQPMACGQPLKDMRGLAPWRSAPASAAVELLVSCKSES